MTAIPSTIRVAARYLATTQGEIRAGAAQAICPELDDLDDPVGVAVSGKRLPSGVYVTERTAPLGVVGLEAPTLELVARCVLSGNIVVAAGLDGDESRTALGGASLPADTVISVESLPLEELDAVVHADGTVVCAERVGTACCVYIDSAADAHQGTYVAVNAAATKTSDTFLIHTDFDAAATEDVLGAWETLELTPAVYAVSSAYEAVDVLDRLSSGRVDAVLSNSARTAREFAEKVDAAAVVLNCSPAFAADLPCERRVIGFTRTKWIFDGSGQTKILQN